MTRASYDAAIIGGGIVGCATAYELAKRGLRVVLLERDRLASGASGAAAGMLAPQSEAHADDQWFRLLLQARDGYERLACELREETGIDVEYRRDGVLKVALDEPERAELQARAAWQQSAGLPAEWLEPSAALSLEPGLSPAVAGALWCQAESQVQAPKVVRALAEAAARRGATILEGTPVLGLEYSAQGDGAHAGKLSYERGSSAVPAHGTLNIAPSRGPGSRSCGLPAPSSGQVKGVRTPTGTIEAESVILTAGVWSAGLQPELPMEPVKGQIVCAQAPTAEAPRHVLWGTHAYLTPKVGGQLLVGATQEASYDTRPTLGAIAELIDGGAGLYPAVTTFPLATTWAGLRPATPDRLPVIGQWPGAERLFVATGHFRNGILLGPITAKAVAALVTGQPPESDLSPYSPERLIGRS